MSHAHSGQDSCENRHTPRRFNSEFVSIARGMTDVSVGSGALLGLSERIALESRNALEKGRPARCEKMK